MISPDKKQRRPKNFYEAAEIIGGQISAGDKQLDIAESPILRQLTEQGLYIVGNYKNLHDLHYSFDGWQLYWNLQGLDTGLCAAGGFKPR